MSTQIMPEDLDLLRKASTDLHAKVRTPGAYSTDVRRRLEHNANKMFAWSTSTLPYQKVDDTELVNVVTILRQAVVA